MIYLIAQFFEAVLLAKGIIALRGTAVHPCLFSPAVRWQLIWKRLYVDLNMDLTYYLLALLAVQELSFGSTKVRHADAIDDILIANNIANSANGEKVESYNYWWVWQDKAGQIQKNLEHQLSGDSTIFSTISARGLVAPMVTTAKDEPISIFGLRCGGLCVSDTTEAK